MSPDYIELENQRSRLVKQTLSSSSLTLQVISFYNYFSKILPYKDQRIEEAFLAEFIEEFIWKLTAYEIWGIDPHLTENLILLINELKNRSIAAPYRDLLIEEGGRLEYQIDILWKLLAGKEPTAGEKLRAYFPLIDDGKENGFYGIIESVTVRISKASGSNKFIIVPSEREIEKRIIEQTKISWDLAFRRLRLYIKKPFPYHEVIISFEKKDGFYQGNSLGLAFTITFLQQLMSFYNPPYAISLIPGTTFTGSLAPTGETAPIGSNVISQKMSAVFYSFAKTFVIPKKDEAAAIEEFRILREKYPSRTLKIIPIETLDDVLNRRDIIEIKKRNAAARTGKFLRKNWISAATILASIVIIFFLFIIDLDDNPSSLSSDGSTLYIKNKNDRVLWTKKISIDNRTFVGNRAITRYAMIVDINSDGMNELIICHESDGKTGYSSLKPILRCYDKNGNQIWKFSFTDFVESKREILNSEYNIWIIDTLTFAGIKSIYLSSTNGPSFSSAIYRIDIKNGRRLSGTLWASGHILDCNMENITVNNKPNIIGAGYDNGYEDLVLFVYPIDTLTSVRPTTEDYIIRGYPAADLKAYIRFPKNDFDNYMKVRTPSYLVNGLLPENNKIKFGSSIPPQNIELETGYAVALNFKDIEINFSSSFRVQRDTLVAHGILKPPYTDTKEYREIIKNNILYWQNGHWVKKIDLE